MAYSGDVQTILVMRMYPKEKTSSEEDPTSEETSWRSVFDNGDMFREVAHDATVALARRFEVATRKGGIYSGLNLLGKLEGARE